MQTLEFSIDKRHWLGGLFCFDVMRGIATIRVSTTFLKMKFLWKLTFSSEGFLGLTYFDVRGYLLGNNIRLGVNTFILDYDSLANKKFIFHHSFTG